jgi:hypothetical protein
VSQENPATEGACGGVPGPLQRLSDRAWGRQGNAWLRSHVSAGEQRRSPPSKRANALCRVLGSFAGKIGPARETSSAVSCCGNITGVFLDFPDFTAKWMEMLVESNPKLSRAAENREPSAAQ